MAAGLALTITGATSETAPTTTLIPPSTPTVVGAVLAVQDRVPHIQTRTHVVVIHTAPKPRPKPKPKPVVHHHHRKHVVSQSRISTGSGGKCGATCQWHKTDAVWAAYPAWVETFALCVSHHESWSGHMWTAENPSSTASGGFQWLDGSWRTALGRAGLSGPGHAGYASPVLQAKVTAHAIVTHQQWNWNGSHCGYGT